MSPQPAFSSVMLSLVCPLLVSLGVFLAGGGVMFWSLSRVFVRPLHFGPWPK